MQMRYRPIVRLYTTEYTISLSLSLSLSLCVCVCSHDMRVYVHVFKCNSNGSSRDSVYGSVIVALLQFTRFIWRM